MNFDDAKGLYKSETLTRSMRTFRVIVKLHRTLSRQIGVGTIIRGQLLAGFDIPQSIETIFFVSGYIWLS